MRKAQLDIIMHTIEVHRKLIKPIMEKMVAMKEKQQGSRWVGPK